MYGVSYSERIQSNGRCLGIVISRDDGSRYKLFWADCNLGAAAPEEYGDYFSWGQSVANKSLYSEATYEFTKYISDGKSVLDLEDDTARVLLGGAWRMPTLQEWQALQNGTTGKWEKKNGVNGLVITSNTTGNTLFLPAAGHVGGRDYCYAGEEGVYWSSTVYSDQVRYAKVCVFSQNRWETPIERREYGASVRAVYAEEFPPIEEKYAEPELVDLGLSVKWATFNLGATKPEETGDCFAWGETEPKEFYSWGKYKWCNGTRSTLTKYCSQDDYGVVDKKEILEKEDDAASVHLGGKWRMPTEEEVRELFSNCQGESATINGVPGIRLTSKKNGYQNASIFIPAKGVCFWSSTRSSISYRAWRSNASYPYTETEERYLGYPIRPVID